MFVGNKEKKAWGFVPLAYQLCIKINSSEILMVAYQKRHVVLKSETPFCRGRNVLVEK